MNQEKRSILEYFGMLNQRENEIVKRYTSTNVLYLNIKIWGSGF